ncbi:hypothetical protein F511_18970 [Dorcoceras hygrometricum]|uniref:Uncharacterized protein n=1 Tax=Dorcoceras hygrometricum TaxID=472368 RepID=A0A2Z7D4Y4_9LAMI|nr:hypothetical protein F511_18970 [Dorcoceras hygrometricum]
MLRLNEEEEIFFDTTDRLMSEESAVAKEEKCNKFVYDIWLQVPLSVKERRENFLRRMDFLEFESEPESERAEVVSISLESQSPISDENLLFDRLESNSEANCSVDYTDEDCLMRDMEKKKKLALWWRNLKQRMKKNSDFKQTRLFSKESKTNPIRIRHYKKKYIECSAVYSGQDLKAHAGPIWSMKFSPDGQYLASGGEDGVVCVWRVSSADASCDANKCILGGRNLGIKPNSKRRRHKDPSIIIPEKIFHIEEEPLHKFYGHSGDVLDLAWSSSNHLLSASKDKTLRLWQIGSDRCLGVFNHSNYVTCVQFNPKNENYFISGSIDGKVRIWGIPSGRVEDWVNARDIVTAVCYHPNGEGFIVGSISGTCRFYELSRDELLLSAEINVCSKKKSSGNKILGVQFLENDPERVMITSEDSKIRLLDGLEFVRKYEGLSKLRAQASVTSNGRHLISTGDDSRIYVWNYNDLSIQTSKQAKSVRSCEHFPSKGVSVAIPWPSCDTEQSIDSLSCGTPAHDQSGACDSGRFSLANWFSMDTSAKGSMTWPEEKLPSWDFQEHGFRPCTDHGDHHLHQRNRHSYSSGMASSTWGLVIVTANLDGTIKTFHNYGLPMKI